MLNVLPLLHVHVTAIFVYAVNSILEFSHTGIILVKVEHDRARLLPRDKITRARGSGIDRGDHTT